MAIYTCLSVVAEGAQAAFMVPTEVLAEQHYRTLKHLLRGSRVRTALLTAGLKAAEKRVKELERELVAVRRGGLGIA